MRYFLAFTLMASAAAADLPVSKPPLNKDPEVGMSGTVTLARFKTRIDATTAVFELLEDIPPEPGKLQLAWVSAVKVEGVDTSKMELGKRYTLPGTWTVTKREKVGGVEMPVIKRL